MTKAERLAEEFCKKNRTFLHMDQQEEREHLFIQGFSAAVEEARKLTNTKAENYGTGDAFFMGIEELYNDLEKLLQEEE